MKSKHVILRAFALVLFGVGLAVLPSCNKKDRNTNSGGGVGPAPEPTPNPAPGIGLTVIKSGNGAGTITSTPNGIDCGNDCSEPFARDTQVTLQATPNNTSTFAGWGGACSGTGNCQVTMTTATTVTAEFTLNPFTLSVQLTGTGGGLVTSTPAGISCGLDCSEAFAPNTQVTLQAAPNNTSTFAGWGGACSGTADCQVSMSEARNVTAQFTLIQFPLNVQTTGDGGGTVSSTPAGISCGLDCSELFTLNTQVTLQATPNNTATFVGWGGACSGMGNCQVSMSEARNVTAQFSLIRYLLSVQKTGAGTGTIMSNPGGISCGLDCSEMYVINTGVSLSAIPTNAFQIFSGWSGDCTGAGACNISMTSNKTVTADFDIASLDGTWIGVTSQNRPFAFLVQNERVASYNYAIATPNCVVSGTHTLATPALITNQTFNISSFYTQLSGQFSSPTTASGSLTYSDFSGCGTRTVSWTASRSFGFAGSSWSGSMETGEKVTILSKGEKP